MVSAAESIRGDAAHTGSKMSYVWTKGDIVDRQVHGTWLSLAYVVWGWIVGPVHAVGAHACREELNIS